MRSGIAWGLSVIAFLAVVFFTFPWFCTESVVDYAPGYEGSDDSSSECGALGILLKRDVPMGFQSPASLLMAFGTAYVVRRVALIGQGGDPDH